MMRASTTVLVGMDRAVDEFNREQLAARDLVPGPDRDAAAARLAHAAQQVAGAAAAAGEHALQASWERTARRWARLAVLVLGGCTAAPLPGPTGDAGTVDATVDVARFDATVDVARPRPSCGCGGTPCAALPDPCGDGGAP